MNISKVLAEELGIKEEQVVATLDLISKGDTIPFIARYRKEVTGSLSDETLRTLSERLDYLTSLEERRTTIIKAIKELGKLTPELEASLNNASKLSELDNLYRPYKKKKTTRASIAKAAGLEPLEQYLEVQEGTPTSLLEEAYHYINLAKGIDSTEKALQGAYDILAEKMSDEASFYDFARSYIYRTGHLKSVQTKEDTLGKYTSYKSFICPVKLLKNYQVLALNRGENDKGLKVSFAYDEYTIINEIARHYLKSHSPYEKEIRECASDAYKRLVGPTVEKDIRHELFTKAEDASILLFKDNLKQLLLASPLKGHRILGFDPAFINGCKLASIDEEGKLLHVGVIYPTIGGPKEKEESAKTLLSFLKNDRLDYIALGNGTASRESEAFIHQVLSANNLDTKVVIVNEAGASVYSASPLGTEEFPELTVEKRSAISLARRLLDPLSELVKIDPMSLGVGQYQHDMDKKKLSLALSGVVEDAVNSVGVYVNAASPSLLSYVSGIGPTLAKSIEDYRKANGPFKTREDLKKVPHLGPKAFEQAAGFCRIIGANPLDNTGVHPESYAATLKLLKLLNLSASSLGVEATTKALASVDASKMAPQVGIGEATLKDILFELQKPGRDPRLEIVGAKLEEKVRDMKDLVPGQILTGTIRNITDFGAFVDIGVHQDGLVHISELSNTPFSSILEVVHLGQIVRVKVLSVDLPRKRISLSMKNLPPLS